MNVRKKPRKKIYPPMLFFMAFSALFAVYIIINLLAMLSYSVSTTVATYSIAEEGFTGSGWFFRDETVMTTSDGQDTIQYTATSGEKVQAQAVLATVYASAEALESNRALEEVEAEIELLQSVSSLAGSYVDTANADSQITQYMQTIDTVSATKTVSSLSDEASDLRKALLRRNASTLSITALNAEIATLQTQADLLASQAIASSRVIVAPSSGYFSEAVDGYENIFTLSALEALTPAAFVALTNMEPKEYEAAFGKIVQGFTWSFAMLATHEQAETLTEGQTVKLRFANTDDVTAKVTSIVYDVSNQALVVFENDQISSDVIGMRNQTVEVITKTYEGIKVPTAAITLQTGTTSSTLGVYILTGDTSRFKAIDKIYEGENFYLVSQGTNESTGLVVGDKIITQATGLADLKVIK